MKEDGEKLRVVLDLDETLIHYNEAQQTQRA